MFIVRNKINFFFYLWYSITTNVCCLEVNRLVNKNLNSAICSKIIVLHRSALNAYFMQQKVWISFETIKNPTRSGMSLKANIKN